MCRKQKRRKGRVGERKRKKNKKGRRKFRGVQDTEGENKNEDNNK
jgi:hypothetical protein